jgi:hypothetical protein
MRDPLADARYVRRFLAAMFGFHDPLARPLRRLFFLVEPPQERGSTFSNPKGAIKMALLRLETDQQARVTLVAKDRRGRPARVDGVPAWGVEPVDVVKVEASEDGMSATVVQVGDPGTTATLTVRADADLGEGMRELTGVLSVAIAEPEAVVVELSAEEPTDVPEA